jgi:uncharacterized protein YoaH (UPF0181 family)
MRPRENWYALPKEQAGPALVALANKYKNQWTARKTRATSLLSLYEGLTLGSFGAEAYDDAQPLTFFGGDGDDGDGDHGTDMVWNLGASIMDSIDAKLFALDRVKTAFVCTDGGWDAKRSAVLASRFVEGAMAEPQGIFADAWALWRHGARLTTSVTGGCMVWFWSDPDEGKIVMELDDTLNTFVSSSGLPYDGTDSVGRITYWDPEKLAARYPKFEAQIFSASERPDHQLQYLDNDGESPPDEVRRVPLVQGFRMKQPGIKGLQVMAIPGATLEHKPYEYDYPPYVHFCPMRQLAGFWGRPLLERIVKPLVRVNEIVSSLDDAERLSPKGSVVYNPTHTSPESLAHIKNVVLLPHVGPPETAPRYDAPAPFHPVVLEWLKMHKEVIYDLIGASEAQVTASREKGLSSGVAIRLVQNLIHERFAPIETEYARCVGPETAKQVIRCAQEIERESGGFKATWKGNEEGGFLREIPASVFDVLTKHKYRVEPQAISGNANTPADRVELAEELMQAGIITGEAYASILQHFDVYSESSSSLSNAEEQYVAQQIDKWLYAEDSELDEPGFYEGPEKWMSSEALMMQVGAAYLEAKIARAPMDRLKFFFQFISELEAQIEQKQARAAQMAAVAQGQAQPPAAAPPIAAE